MVSAIGEGFHFIILVVCRFFWGMFNSEHASGNETLYAQLHEYGLSNNLYGGDEISSLRPLLWLIFFGVGISLVLFCIKFVYKLVKGV